MIEDILNVIGIREESYDSMIDFVEVFETKNLFVDLSFLNRPGILRDSLVLGSYFPKKGDKGIVFIVNKKYPCFYPLFSGENIFKSQPGDIKYEISISQNTEIKKLSYQENVKLILSYCKKLHVVDINHIAFILGSAEQESGLDNTADNKEEKNSGRYGNFWGRGLPQITLETNYIKFNGLLKQDFIVNPDLVKIPDYSAFILVYGMKNGTFTGLSLDDFLDDLTLDLNETDQTKIAKLEQNFYNARQILTGKNRFQGAENTRKYALNWRRKILRGEI